MNAAMRALRKVGTTRRGLHDDFLHDVADRYTELVAGGERSPVTTIAKADGVDKSTASRWISAARRRGFLPDKGA